jgi:integrase/recombinase XerD
MRTSPGHLFQARRADIEAFSRQPEAAGRARAMSQRPCTSPACTDTPWKRTSSTVPRSHFRRPRLDSESHAVGLDGNEDGALLVAAGLSGPAEHARQRLTEKRRRRLRRRQ